MEVSLSKRILLIARRDHSWHGPIPHNRLIALVLRVGKTECIAQWMARWQEQTSVAEERSRTLEGNRWTWKQFSRRGPKVYCETLDDGGAEGRSRPTYHKNAQRHDRFILACLKLTTHSTAPPADTNAQEEKHILQSRNDSRNSNPLGLSLRCEVAQTAYEDTVRPTLLGARGGEPMSL